MDDRNVLDRLKESASGAFDIVTTLGGAALGKVSPTSGADLVVERVSNDCKVIATHMNGGIPFESGAPAQMTIDGGLESLYPEALIIRLKILLDSVAHDLFAGKAVEESRFTTIIEACEAMKTLACEELELSDTQRLMLDLIAANQ